MSDFARGIRKLVRFLLAGIIWAHALFVFQVPDTALNRLLPRLHTSLGEFFVVALIIGLSILTSYGWGKVTVDLIYIYFFPFILLFHIGRLGIRFSVKLGTFIEGNGNSQTADTPYYARLSLPVLVPSATARPKGHKLPLEPPRRSRSLARLGNCYYGLFGSIPSCGAFYYS